MNTHEHTHSGHEPDEFKNVYAVWAIPFSLVLLFVFVLIVTLWAPAAASKEMRAKELAGAEASRAGYFEHDEEDAEELGDIEESMRAVVRENENR